MRSMLSFRMTHSYFRSARLDQCDFVPDATTLAVMSRFGLLMHQCDSMWCIAADSMQAMPAFIRYLIECQDVSVLKFEIRYPIEWFYNITQIPKNAVGPFQLSTLAAGPVLPDGALSLAPAFDTGMQPGDGVIGQLEIDLSSLAKHEQFPVTFEAQFAARDVGWRYYLVNSNGSVLQRPMIKDRRGVALDGPKAVTMRDGQAAVMFDSGVGTFPLQEQPEHIFDLYDTRDAAFQAEGQGGEQCLIKGLPTPSPGQLSIEPDAYSQSFFCAMFVYV